LTSIVSLKFISRESDSIFLRISNELFDNNRIELKCDGIETKDVDVVWRSEDNEKVIIKSGRKINKIGNDYGPNELEVKISNNIVFKLGNWKTANWHTHNYRIDIKKGLNGYKVNFIANGIDYEREEEEFDINGKRNGFYKSYYENGNLSVQGTYTNGLEEGQFIYYFKNGNIRATTDYLNGKINGYRISYTPDGKIEFKTKYSFGNEILETK
jgi:antitoxin component YwqK of YwqJK toxin-antitoxin module